MSAKTEPSPPSNQPPTVAPVATDTATCSPDRVPDSRRLAHPHGKGCWACISRLFGLPPPRLTASLRSRVSALIARDPAACSKTEMDEIERLEKVRQVDHALRRSVHKRWLAFFGLIGVALCFARLRTTLVEIEVGASAVQLCTTRDATNPLAFTEPIDLSTVTASAIDEVRLACGQVAWGKHFDQGVAARISVPKDKGSATMESVELPPGTVLHAATDEATPRHAVTLSDATGTLREIRLSILGQTRAEAGLEGRTFECKAPGAITLRFSPGSIALVIGLDGPSATNDTSGAALLRGPRIESLSFERTRNPEERDLRSSVLDGRITLEEIHGTERLVRLGETLTLAKPNGTVRGLDLTPHGVRLAYRGQVGGMAAGTPNARRDLMPAVSEWLRSELSGLGFRFPFGGSAGGD